MCLKQTIGVRNHCDEQSVLYYINDLEGITLNFADSINNEVNSGIELINQKKELAEKLVVNEIQNFFNNKIVSDSLIDSDVVGTYYENQKTTPAIPGKSGGILFESFNGSNKKLSIHSFSLNLSTVQTVNVKGIDLITGKEVFSKPVTTISNEPVEVVVNYEHKGKGQKIQLFIGWELDFDSIDGSLYNNYFCNTCNGFTHSNRYLSISTGTLAGGNKKSNYTGTGSIYGVSVNYSLSCDLESFVCRNASLLALPYLYKVGELLMREARYSDLSNSYILVNYDQNEELMNAFSTYYQDAMKNVLSKMTLPQNDDCFKCFGAMKRIVNIP